ncbi:MAG TPA: TetR family transcriptional regulator [Microthrixaceae bacterium]|nr:TetR family transcriptional regulator [Microthrixaceae bacterium]
MTTVDGRRERGVASRHRILTAASVVIVETGVGGLTHRAVAEHAGVPLARVSYHFPTVEDLMVAATSRYLDDFDERLTRMASAAVADGRPLIDACTDFLEELVGLGAREFLAMVEVRLALHRRGRVADDQHVLRVVRSFGVTDEIAGSVVASLFGFAVLAATTDTVIPRALIRTHVGAVLEGRASDLVPKEAER